MRGFMDDFFPLIGIVLPIFIFVGIIGLFVWSIKSEKRQK